MLCAFGTWQNLITSTRLLILHSAYYDFRKYTIKYVFDSALNLIDDNIMILVTQYGAFHGRFGAEAACSMDALQLFVATHPMSESVPAHNIYNLNVPLEFPQKVLSKLGRILGWQALIHRQTIIDTICKNLFARLTACKINNQTTIFHAYSAFQECCWDRCDQLSIRKVIDWGIAHPAFLNEILSEEYERLGLAKYKASNSQRILDELNRADRIVIPSSFVKNSFLLKGFAQEKLFCNPYGVSLDTFVPAPRMIKINSPIRIAFAGALSVRKGVVYLLEAIRLLNLKGVRTELYLYGDWEDDLASIVKKYSAQITHQGGLSQQNLAMSLAQADVFVLPSLAEGMARVVLEAMACGVPCIVTPNTGYEEIIINGENGLIVPIRNSEAIADCIQMLYEDPVMRNSMASRALSTAQRNSWEKYKLKLQSLYRELQYA